MYKRLSQSTLDEILWQFRDYLDGNFFNQDIEEGDPDYMPIVLDEPPDYDYKRAVVIEISDNDCFGFDNDREYMTVILSLWYNAELINEGRDSDEKPFSFKDAQSESRIVYRKIKYDAPHPFVGKLTPLTVSRVSTEEDLICYSLPYKCYIS